MLAAFRRYRHSPTATFAFQPRAVNDPGVAFRLL
jgi:hypothetical protein